MKNRILLLIALAVFLGCNDNNFDSRIILRKANVVDLLTGSIIYDQSIIIQSGLIEKIDSSTDKITTLNGDQIIDCENKFVIPGLWDMHVHITDATEMALPMLLASGVVGVRDMGGDISQIDSIISRINDGSIIGPKIFRPGNYLDGKKPGLPYRITLSDLNDVKDAIQTLKFQNADFIKIHNLVPREIYFDLLRIAKIENLDVVGHIPVDVSPYEASNAGQHSFEHMNTLFEGTFLSRFSGQSELINGIKNWVEIESDSLIQIMKNNHTWMTPNLVALKTRAEKGNSNRNPDSRRAYVAKSLQQQWDNYFPISEKDSLPEIINVRYEYLQYMMKLTGKFQKSQIGLLAGSDLALRDIYPGSGLHDELELLSESGLTPLEALKCATINPAKFLEIENEYGSIEENKKAAIVILDKNPLLSIKNVKEISAVIVNMTVYNKEDLEQLTDQVKLNAENY